MELDTDAKIVQNFTKKKIKNTIQANLTKPVIIKLLDYLD